MASIDGNQVLRQLKQARLLTPKHFGTISTPGGKVLASAQGSKPLEAEPIAEVKLTQKQQFINQIQNYNDFIVQNDLDENKIDVDHDYDFSAFNTPQDFAIESERLADRLSDRKIEIKQNEDNGEFQGLEIEGGMPSFESTQNMSDEEYAEYEKKYLLPSKAETLTEPQVQQSKQSSTPTISAETILSGSAESKLPLNLSKPNAVKTFRDRDKSSSKVAVPSDVGSRVTDKPFDAYSADGVRDFVQDGIGSLFRSRDEGRDPRYMPKDLYREQIQRKKYAELSAARYRQKLKDSNQTLQNETVLEPKTDNGPSALRSLAAGQSFPIAKGIATTAGSIARLKDQYEKNGAVPILEDVGNGTMAALAEPFSKSSSDFWKNRLNTPKGEASSVGKNIGDEALFGAAGGVIGKVGGTIYKGMRNSAETARNKIIRLADEQAQKATDKVAKQQADNDFFDKIMGTSSPKVNMDAISREKLKVYEQMTGSVPPDPYHLPPSKMDEVKKFIRGKKSSPEPYDFVPAWVKGVDKISNGIKKEFGSVGMIRKNDTQLEDYFTKVGNLNKARAMQKNQWDQLPDQGLKLGAVLGVGMNDEDDEDDDSGSTIVGTPTKPITPLINPLKKHGGVGSMKNNGRTAVTSGI